MRDAVLTLLRGDDALATIAAEAASAFVVVPEYESDQRPSDGPFIVVCWRAVDFTRAIQDNGPKHFDLWFHIPSAAATGFGLIDNMIDRCDTIFRAIEDGDPLVGADGWQLEQVGFAGRGIDVTDEGYETICKSASYYALGSKTS